jgi:hypothetical protein
VEPEEWLAFAAAWQAREEAQRWADPSPPAGVRERRAAAGLEHTADDDCMGA